MQKGLREGLWNPQPNKCHRMEGMWHGLIIRDVLHASLIDGLCVLRWGGLNKAWLPVAAMNNDICLYSCRKGEKFLLPFYFFLFFPPWVYLQTFPHWKYGLWGNLLSSPQSLSMATILIPTEVSLAPLPCVSSVWNIARQDSFIMQTLMLPGPWELPLPPLN